MSKIDNILTQISSEYGDVIALLMKHKEWDGGANHMVKVINEAKSQLLKAIMEVKPKNHEVDPIANSDYRYCIGWNESMEYWESAIKELFGEES